MVKMAEQNQMKILFIALQRVEHITINAFVICYKQLESVNVVQTFNKQLESSFDTMFISNENIQPLEIGCNSCDKD